MLETCLQGLETSSTLRGNFKQPSKYHSEENKLWKPQLMPWNEHQPTAIGLTVGANIPKESTESGDLCTLEY